MKEENNFAAWLKDAREDAGLTQQQLADAARLSPSYISALETNYQKKVIGKTTQIDLEKCDRLSIALGKTIIEGRRAAGYVPDVDADADFQAIALELNELDESQRREAFLEMKRAFDKYKNRDQKKLRRTAAGGAASKEKKLLL